MESGAKISIRGKGAQKDLRMDTAMLATADEELHAVVMADTQEKFDKAVAIINGIIERACSNPEEANELRKQQLLELQKMNGTARPEETSFARIVVNTDIASTSASNPLPWPTDSLVMYAGESAMWGWTVCTRTIRPCCRHPPRGQNKWTSSMRHSWRKSGEDKGQQGRQAQSVDPSAYYMQQLYQQQQQYMLDQPGMDPLPYTYASPDHNNNNTRYPPAATTPSTFPLHPPN